MASVGDFKRSAAMQTKAVAVNGFESLAPAELKVTISAPHSVEMLSDGDIKRSADYAAQISDKG